MLEGKVALVTGGSRGIGKAVALALAAHGAKVAITYARKKTAAEGVAEALKKKTDGLALRAKVERREEVASAIQQTVDAFGRLDIVINNAVSAVLRPFIELTPKHWQYTLDVSLNGFFHLAQEAFPHLAESKGVFISITSLGSRRALPGYGALGACKAAIEALTRQLAAEWGERGVRVNAVCGGPIETEAILVLPDYERHKELWTKLTPLGRMGQPEDLGGAVVLLCSPLARWINGEVLVVDGGLSVR